ncbi:Peroxiredoxin Bcp [Methylobacterium adhaesivum]|uniref:Peroxiredoxin n=1 Tax=Methylobacterium adhaesivum TaxID=333297 RepID=A0ABT8BGI1_9HYPH|nr:peroxiredoxin [Methylobacterium adhaesivum]MDN3590875.1 peroxiredoxin [Methylobacterium adhaesivum]GJD29737.1 Peroxiredoxin Bcp [Methylobacterium adhaesivum]
MTPDFSSLPADLPAPVDDGGARHLEGMIAPDVSLEATDGTRVSLHRLKGRAVVYAYPRTGEPGQPTLVPDWDAIPGARGCTPQACDFRDHHAGLVRRGVAHVHGLSTQTSAYQREVATRLHLPFSLLADPHGALTRAMTLPTFTAGGLTLLRRLTLVLDDGRVTKVFYPVFPPDRSAEQVIAWLDARA